VTYPGTLAVSTAHLNRVADLLRAHRNRIRSPWRRLSCGQQALLVLAHLRNGDTYARLAEGFAVGLPRCSDTCGRRSTCSPRRRRR
jgi:hypothetical protein